MTTTLSPELLHKASEVRLLALDVDGVLTDGRLWFGNSGEEMKAFDIQDGLGVKLLQRGGVSVALITGRQSELVARRARELGIEQVIQGREDKRIALAELCQQLGLQLAQAAYMGDDLPDLGAIRAAGLGLAPANAHDLVAAHADLQTRRCGGAGAVREACELILRAQGKLDTLLEAYL
jgi:3-deoxy-D-manno-octulosonate 8-phosphate phosphatase (KDO 8-P phosphatase)